MARRKRSKKQLLKQITNYGIHIWAILIIATAVMVYTYHFASHISGKNIASKFLDASQIPTPSDQISPTDIPPTDIPTDQPQPTATGNPAINLTFTVPGIGSGGGVMNPLHPQRNVTVFLYATDVNSLNQTVKPLYTIQGYATFDSNPYSPTYTSFINPNFDLGSAVQDGNYQISFRTDQSLRTLIKQNPTDIGGEVVSLGKNNDPVIIPPQTVLMGDIVPDQGDNVINISDYNAFLNCYGAKSASSFCQRKNYGDFDDDGVVDGVDYNILIRSLNTLAQEGLYVPIVSPTPKRISRPIHHVTPTQILKKTSITTIPTKAAPQKNGNSPFGTILFIFIFIVLAVGGFILYRKNQDAIKALIHLSPTGTPTPEIDDQTTENKETTPEESLPTTEQPSHDTKEKDTSPSQSSGVIEKDCYVKTKGPDEEGGMWLLLTDDNGPVQAHYSKNDAKDGFAKVKGTMKTKNGKTFFEILELSAEE